MASSKLSQWEQAYKDKLLSDSGGDFSAAMKASESEAVFDSLASDRWAVEQQKKADGTWNYDWAPTNEIFFQGSTNNKSSESTAAVNPYSQYLSQQQAATQAATQAGIAALESQKGTIEQDYDDLAKELYANYRLNQKNLASQTAQLATGTADSYTLQNNLDYENRLNQNEKDRSAALADVDSDISQLQAEGQMNLAQLAEKYALLAIENAQYQQEREDELAYRQWQMQQAESEADYTREQQQQELAYEKVINAIQMGAYRPGYGETLGMDEATARYIASLYAQKLSGTGSGSKRSSSAGRSSSASSQTQATASVYASLLQNLQNDHLTQDVRKAQINAAYQSGKINAAQRDTLLQTFGLDG